MTERFNRALQSMLGTLNDIHKQDWKSYVAPLVHAYLMFGRFPRLAVVAFLGMKAPGESGKNAGTYVSKLKSRLNFAYKTAARQAKKRAHRSKDMYDTKVRESLVLIRNVGLKGKHKLADRWNRQPYVVTAQPNKDIPVFAVKRNNARVKLNCFIAIYCSHS